MKVLMLEISALVEIAIAFFSKPTHFFDQDLFGYISEMTLTVVRDKGKSFFFNLFLQSEGKGTC